MSIEVLEGGFETTVQDFPGRLGYWNVGIPPSGPFDSLSFRIANLLVGNQPRDAGLEITLLGPRLRFRRSVTIAVTGADMAPKLNEEPLPAWTTVGVKDGDVLSFGPCRSGCRSYLAITGGIEVPEVIGSKSTYIKGLLGGHEGRKLMKGDTLKLGRIWRSEAEVER
ncbi:MAG: biotin-dependent carboxyltransferase family protein [Candidatus Bathyarchaeia archaeon]